MMDDIIGLCQSSCDSVEVLILILRRISNVYCERVDVPDEVTTVTSISQYGFTALDFRCTFGWRKIASTWLLLEDSFALQGSRPHVSSANSGSLISRPQQYSMNISVWFQWDNATEWQRSISVLRHSVAKTRGCMLRNRNLPSWLVEPRTVLTAIRLAPNG